MAVKISAIILVIILNCYKIDAQNINIGAKFSVFNIAIDKQEQSDTYLSVFNINGILEIELNDVWRISAQNGFLITIDQPYNGFEINTLVRYEFERRKEYLNVGINMLNNKSGSSSASYSNGEFLVNGLIGAGMFFSNNVFVQVSLIYPLTRSDIGYFQTKNTLGHIETSPIKFNYIFKLSVGFIVDL